MDDVRVVDVLIVGLLGLILLVALFHDNEVVRNLEAVHVHVHECVGVKE